MKHDKYEDIDILLQCAQALGYTKEQVSSSMGKFAAKYEYDLNYIDRKISEMKWS